MSRAEGVWGEAQIANYLRRRRYELLAHSYHCRFGEIDLIARKGGVLCFVEVKTRSEDSYYAPREAVTDMKQQRIIKTAGIYLHTFPTDLQPRFDVVEIVTRKGRPLEPVSIDHFMAAYETGDLHASF